MRSSPAWRNLSMPPLQVEGWEGLLLKSLEGARTLVITGPTGCGKSTLVPPLLVKSFPTARVLLVQPRRLPTEKLADYICRKNGWTIGNEVGILMGRRHFMRTENRLVLATTGSAFNALMSAPGYFDFVIIDEIHEMSVDIDKTIAICRVFQALHGFKLLLMSATIDVSNFLTTIPDSRHFALGVIAREEHTIYEHFVADCTINNHSLRARIIPKKGPNGFSAFSASPAFFNKYPEKSGILDNMALLIYQILEGECPHSFPGDILVFLPGLSEFRALKTRLTDMKKRVKGKGFKLEYLHSRFSDEYKSYLGDGAGASKKPAKKEGSSKKERTRAVIFTTNLCETSLTLPNVSYVVDSCMSRKKLFVGGQFRLVTVPACYEAMMQRRGRLGRVADGMYCVAVQDEIVSLLPRNYGTELMLESLDHFLLAYYSNEVASLASGLGPDKLLAGSMSKVSSEQVHFVQGELFKQGLLRRTRDNAISISSLGFLPAALKVNVDMARRVASAVFLGIPYVGLIFGALDTSTTAIFVHSMEVLQSSKAYANSLPDEGAVALAAARFNPFFKCFSAGSLKEPGSLYVYRPDEINLPVEEWKNNMLAFVPPQSPALSSGEKLVDIFHRQGITPFESTYSELLSICHIVCMWRQMFPIPTRDPTRAEEEWCCNRLLSPSGLRELELEAINLRLKLSAQGILSPPARIEADMLHGVYPTTASALEAKYTSFETFKPPPGSNISRGCALINYVTMSEYLKATARLKAQFGISYTPTVLGVYHEEKKHGPENMVRLAGLVSLMSGCQGFLSANGSNDSSVRILGKPSTAASLWTSTPKTNYHTYLSDPWKLMPVILKDPQDQIYMDDLGDYLVAHGSLKPSSAEPRKFSDGSTSRRGVEVFLSQQAISEALGQKWPSTRDVLRKYYENAITVAENIPYLSTAKGAPLSRRSLLGDGVAKMVDGFRPSLMPTFSVYAFVLEANKLAADYNKLLGDSEGEMNVGLGQDAVERLKAAQEGDQVSSTVTRAGTQLEFTSSSSAVTSSVATGESTTKDACDTPEGASSTFPEDRTHGEWQSQSKKAIVEMPSRGGGFKGDEASPSAVPKERTPLITERFKGAERHMLPAYFLKGTHLPMHTSLQACTSPVLDPATAAAHFIPKTLSLYVGRYEPMFGGLKTVTIVPEGVAALLLGRLLSHPCDRVYIKNASVIIQASGQPIFFYAPPTQVDIRELKKRQMAMAPGQDYAYSLILALSAVLREFEALLNEFSAPSEMKTDESSEEGEEDESSEDAEESSEASDVSDASGADPIAAEPTALSTGFPALFLHTFRIYLDNDLPDTPSEAQVKAGLAVIAKKLKLYQYLRFADVVNSIGPCPQTQRFREACLAFLQVFADVPESLALATIGLWQSDARKENLRSWVEFGALSVRAGRRIKAASVATGGSN